jgi:hypothetical protein
MQAITCVNTVGQDIDRIVQLMDKLYKGTQVEFFYTQAQAWSQWVDMLMPDKKKEWGLE